MKLAVVIRGVGTRLCADYGGQEKGAKLTEEITSSIMVQLLSYNLKCTTYFNCIRIFFFCLYILYLFIYRGDIIYSKREH